MYSTKTVSSQTTSPWIPLDDNQAAFSATVAVAVSGTLTYTVEFTLDNVQDPSVTPVAFPIGLVGETASNSTYLRSPVKAVRLNVTAFTSGSATIGVRQGTDNVWGYPDSTDFAEAFSTSAKTLWASGALFWIPAGDGGTNGLIFAGGGTGDFILSAAVVTGFTVPQGWIYLTANAGGLSNPAGWYFFTMSDDTHGKIYTTTYDSTSGVVPVFPASPVEMAFTSATRLTSTTSFIQAFQVPVNFVSQMGINGSIEQVQAIYGSASASNKFLQTKAGNYTLNELSPTTLPIMEGYLVTTNAGSMSKQICTRAGNSVGNAGAASLSTNFRTVNLSAESSLNVYLRNVALTDHVAGVVRKITVTYGG